MNRQGLFNRIMPMARIKNGRAVSFTLNQAMSPAHRARVAHTALFWEYYKGHQRQPLKVRRDQPDYNLIENWARHIVNASVDFLFSPSLGFDVESGDERAQAVVNAAWADNPITGFNYGQFKQELGQSGANGRNAFIRINLDEVGSTSLKIVNPDMVEIITDHMDIDTVIAYLLLWQHDDDVFRQVITRNDAGEWDVFKEKFTGGNGWVRTDDEVEVWPFPFPPIFHAKNLPLAHSVWGQSDLEDLVLQDSINRIGSDVNKIIGYNAKPQGFAKGLIATEVDAAPDKFIGLPPDGELGYLEMSSDLTANREFKERITNTFHTITDTPVQNDLKVSVGALSGFALRILLTPAINKAKRKRDTYGGLFAQVNHALLSIAGFQDTAVSNVWGSILPENETELVQNMVALMSQGIDAQAAAEFLGVEREMAKALAATAVSLPTLSPIQQILNG